MNNTNNTVVYHVYLECHEDNGRPYPLLASFATEEQAEQYIESMQEPHKFYAFIEKETHIEDKINE